MTGMTIFTICRKEAQGIKLLLGQLLEQLYGPDSRARYRTLSLRSSRGEAGSMHRIYQ